MCKACREATTSHRRFLLLIAARHFRQESLYPMNPKAADRYLSDEIYRAACDPGALGVFRSVFYLPPPRPLDHLIREYGGPTLILQGEGPSAFTLLPQPPLAHRSYSSFGDATSIVLPSFSLSPSLHISCPFPPCRRIILPNSFSLLPHSLPSPFPCSLPPLCNSPPLSYALSRLLSLPHSPTFPFSPSCHLPSPPSRSPPFSLILPPFLLHLPP